MQKNINYLKIKVEIENKNKFIEEIKKTEMYKDVKKIFSDANLIEIESNFKDKG